MATALYRKYRPQTFAELVGQNHIKTTVQNELASGRIAHAYLFSGPRGLGKTTVARLIAKSVNCLKRKPGQSEPCNECDSCTEIMESRSIDVVEIDAASHTGVDNVRENIIANSRFTPTNRNYKVFIIDEVHMLSVSAFNALLKTLEEPPAHAMFILATTEIHKIPETIISRCQRFDFRKVTTEDIISRLKILAKKEKRIIDDNVFAAIARAGHGSIRDAESLLGQVISLDDKKITLEQATLVLPASDIGSVLELLDYISKNNATEAIRLVNKLVEEGVDLVNFTSDIIEVSRRLLLLSVNKQLADYAMTVDTKHQKTIEAIVSLVKPSRLATIIEAFIVAKNSLKSADVIQLPLELAIIALTQENDAGGSISSGSGLTQPKKSGQNTSSPKIMRKAVVVKPDSSTPVQVKSKAAAKPLNITFEHIKSKWDEVLNVIKGYNQSLASTLKHHRPSALNENGAIQIGFRYKFYQQRVAEKRNTELIEQALMAVYNQPLRVEAVMLKKKTSDSDQQPLNAIVEQFGGRIIE